VDGVEGVESRGGGVFEVLLQGGAAGFLEDVSNVIYGMGAGVLEFRPYSLTLEEIFMRAVSEDVGVVE
jgi:hypothetical protein